MYGGVSFPSVPTALFIIQRFAVFWQDPVAGVVMVTTNPVFSPGTTPFRRLVFVIGLCNLL